MTDPARPWDAKKAQAQRQPLTTSGWLVRIAVGVAVLALIGWGVSAFQASSERLERTGSESGARVACRDFVRDQLRSPGSADFSSEVATLGPGDRWEVTGIVDSENAFGAAIRNGFSCDLRYAGDDRWSLVDLQTDGN